MLEGYRALEDFDRMFQREGVHLLAGVDEAGRGALAGPVVAAAVVLPPLAGLLGVTDSKRLRPERREQLYGAILERAVAVGVAWSGPTFIDRNNILVATLSAMARAVARLTVSPDVILVDGNDGFEHPARVVPVPGGDGKSLAVAAASIVAKVTRDRMMDRLHRRYPAYNFRANKGYGTREHREAIIRHGMIAEHRKSYRIKGIEKDPKML